MKRMFSGLFGAIALVAGLVAGPSAAAPPSGPAAERVCRFTDDRITESSGLAYSTDGSRVFTHNDSGDSARFFAVDPRTCRTTATYRLDLPEVPVPGVGTVTSLDWEDMARGVAADGTPVLLLADIGDNYQIRAGGVTVYEVAEPSGRGSDPGVETALPVRAAYQLLYPSGPVDAESLVALPDGRLAVVTKDRDATTLAYTGRSQVYVSEGRPSSGPVRLTTWADLDATRLPGATTSDPDSIAFSGADVTRDGRWLAVRTYRTAYVYDLRRGFTAPVVVPLLPSKQGEALAWAPDGRTFLTSSEGSGASTDRTSGVLDRYRPRLR